MSQPTPTPNTLRRIAVAAHCSPPTVGRYFAGLPVRPSIRERIEEALKIEEIADRWAAHKAAGEEASNA